MDEICLQTIRTRAELWGCGEWFEWLGLVEDCKHASLEVANTDVPGEVEKESAKFPSCANIDDVELLGIEEARIWICTSFCVFGAKTAVAVVDDADEAGMEILSSDNRRT